MKRFPEEWSLLHLPSFSWLTHEMDFWFFLLSYCKSYTILDFPFLIVFNTSDIYKKIPQFLSMPELLTTLKCVSAGNMNLQCRSVPETSFRVSWAPWSPLDSKDMFCILYFTGKSQHLVPQGSLVPLCKPSSWYLLVLPKKRGRTKLRE